MKNILRKNLKDSLIMILRPGYACPRCLQESWVTSENKPEIKKGWCKSCAFSGEPLKIK